MTYTSEEFEVPENPSRNNIQKDPTTDSILISDDEDIPEEEHILISDSEDSDYIYPDVEWSEGDVFADDEVVNDITITHVDSTFDTVLVQPEIECIKLEMSDSETETSSTKSVVEDTPANSRKRKNSFVRDLIPKKF